MPMPQQFVKAAVQEIGVKESPPGSNKVKYNTWYYGKAVSGAAYPWCMTFVQWCAAQCGVPLPIKTASCTVLMNAAKKSGQWVTNGYRTGDIVIYDFTGNRKAPVHTGIVESAAASGVTAIEGNTGTGNDADGGAVMRRTRANKFIMGAVRPIFGETEKGDDTMTGEEIYKALNDYCAKQTLPDWAKEEFDKAVALGVTDGSSPMGLIPRYQAAIMAYRAAHKRVNADENTQENAEDIAQ